MQEFQRLVNAAHKAGMEAGTEASPRAMVVGTPTTPLGNNIDRSKPTYYVADGVCGMAWVEVRPRNCKFARWLVEVGLGKA